MKRFFLIILLIAFALIVIIGISRMDKPQQQVIEAKTTDPSRFIHIPRENYSKGKWDNYGPSNDSTDHTYMSRTGSISYSLAIGQTLLTHDEVEISVKASSELRGTKSTEMTFSSDVTLFVNGVEQATLNIIPDNGVGETQTWKVSKSVFKPDDQNEITFVVKKDAFYKNGIAFYSPIQLKF